MKHFTTLLMIVLFSNFSQAQDKNYDSLWKQVENLEIKGLPKSALQIVEQITLEAKKDNNQPQIIKCLLFKSKFAMTLKEDAQLQIINDFKSEINQSKFPTKNILESLLANLYWQYFQQNRWKFYNRTNTSEKVGDTDFRTWDLETLFAEIQLHYNKSLQNGLAAQRTSLSDFDALLNQQENSKHYRPSLFDFLSHNALQFYKTDENSISKPAYKFELENPDLLSDGNTFSRLEIESKDENSLQLQALKIYQSLIKFHLQNNRIQALTAVNIERLQFVKQHATFNNKESILLNTYLSESKKLSSQEVSGLYDYEIASIYKQQGQSFNPKTATQNQWKNKEALELCENEISKFPKSIGAKKCMALKNSILQKNLNILVESFVSIQTPSRILVNYKNYQQLQFKVCTISENQLEKINKLYQKEEQLSFIKKLSVLQQWQSTLKNEGDFQQHSTEVLLPKLAKGNYLIFSSDADGETFAYGTLKVTNIALVDKSDNTHIKYQVIDRNNGTPLVKAEAKLSYKTNNNRFTKTQTLLSDKNGEISLAKTNEYLRNIKIEVNYKEDSVTFGDYYSGRHYRDNQEEIKTTYNSFLFTDRSIYRPSQTVYFKGIVIQTKEHKSTVVANKKVIATLYNVNDEDLKKIELVTNEYGSVSGEFILPNGGLTGQFYIELDSDEIDIYKETYFSVEEYKRPKFETHFLPVTETIKVNDSVTLKGEALAYAGSNITDAKVVFRVKRNVQYPHWYFWYRPWFNSEPQEITHGETTTNDKGEYQITFKAQADQSVSKESFPIFNYEITADVTDINGETRSSTTIVKVGYHALTANMTIAKKLDKNLKDHKISLDTKNLNGEFVSAKGKITIHKLQAPSQVLRKRPWEAPDYADFSETEFKTQFPHDAYTNEDDFKNWKKGNLVFSESFDTQISKELALGRIKNWESGKYIIELESQDKFGQAIKDMQYVTLFSSKDKSLADQQLFSVTSNQSQYKHGESVLLSFSTAATNLAVTITIEKDHVITDTYILQLAKNTKSISIPVLAEDIGGFAIHYSYAAFNSFETKSLAISVPYPKTELQIETLTFRDKLQPGQEETWTFKIKGPQGEKVSAEILASMYDASLDAFKPHAWSFHPLDQPLYYSNNRNNGTKSFGTHVFRVHQKPRTSVANFNQGFDQLNWFGFYFGNRYGGGILNEMANTKRSMRAPQPEAMMAEDAELEEVIVTAQGINKEKKVLGYAVSENADKSLSGKLEGVEITTTKKPNFDDVVIRKNLQETAFFFPHLQTDKDGNVSFSFTTPEALTKWKLQLLAHTKTLESSVATFETVTQKELMVMPNVPRFLREGDQIFISTKIANITNKDLEGMAVLQLFDALTGESIDQKLSNAYNDYGFTVKAKGNTQLTWNLNIPFDVQAVQYKIIAKAGNFSDGEQNVLPVLSNRMLVTETMPMWIRSNQTKTFTLDKLKNISTTLNTGNSTSLKNHQLTLEMTSNPAWYAVQALPYLMEYPYECNEQTFSRYYANALASHIANSNPKIQEVFNQWNASAGSATSLLSNLEKNQELKSLLIQETPWLRDAQSESEQKKRIALLFDLNKMQSELDGAMRKLQQNQMHSGGWSWFNGGRESRFITQHILTGFGHLKKLNVKGNDKTMGAESSQQKMIKKAMHYLDAQFVKQYKDIKKYNKDVDLNKDHLSYSQLQYLYMRSFFPEQKTSKEVSEIMNYYHGQIKKYWLSRSLYAKGLMGLITFRRKDTKTANAILKSLKENSITSEELGMYWKDNTNSWFWHQAPIETQSLLIEAFSEIENDTKTVDNLKIWLLKNKQTNRWKTTKATTEAVYALLLQGSDWISVTDMVEIVIGGKKLSPSTLENVKVEAGTGYFKTSWKNKEITPEMAEVSISKKGKGIAWGALYWQYFEDLDKITSAETPLQLSKKLFIKTNTDTGEELSEIVSETQVNVGDLVRVRIEIKVDRPMEFVHLKDMRAASFEPINVISTYKWQDGLGYYESTKDAATNFFFDYLPKGVYVFEYDVRANNAGDFSNGISTIQSMYAPEFSSHSEGVRVKVK